jgi:hypothetical protein
MPPVPQEDRSADQGELSDKIDKLTRRVDDLIEQSSRVQGAASFEFRDRRIPSFTPDRELHANGRRRTDRMVGRIRRGELMAAPGENLKINGERLWDSLMEMAKIGPGIAGGNNRQTLTDEDSEGRHCSRNGARLPA